MPLAACKGGPVSPERLSNQVAGTTETPPGFGVSDEELWIARATDAEATGGPPWRFPGVSS